MPDNVVPQMDAPIFKEERVSGRIMSGEHEHRAITPESTFPWPMRFGPPFCVQIRARGSGPSPSDELKAKSRADIRKREFFITRVVPRGEGHVGLGHLP